jgi:hypothetical protein
MVAQGKDLWSLVWGRPEVDPSDLADAIQDQVRKDDLDYRTRLLVRDSLDALRHHWGQARLDAWLAKSPARRRMETIWHEPFDEAGFPTLRERIVEKTDPEVVRQFFRELGAHVDQPVRLQVGDSIALILQGLLARATVDVDLVDEVPAELRLQHSLLAELRKRYGLILAHFQRHYLPMGWEQRLRFFGSFGEVRVYLLDTQDVFLSKLSSIRSKDLDDLRVLAPQLDKPSLVLRLKESCSSMLAASDLRQRMEKNWYIVYGEPLPSGE